MILKPYAVEVSNLCNLSCSYCCIHEQKAPQGLMSPRVFGKAVELHLLSGKKEIILHNIGEPFMNPDIYEYIYYAKGKGLKVHLSTNNTLLDSEDIDALVELNIDLIVVSIHKGQKLQGDYSRLPVIFRDFNQDFPVHDWGKTKTGRAPGNRICKESYVIKWNGDIYNCCIDVNSYTGLSVDDLLSGKTPFHVSSDRCQSCDVYPTSFELYSF